jgi:sugar/nucleoside kinase (ribokinase family)
MSVQAKNRDRLSRFERQTKDIFMTEPAAAQTSLITGMGAALVDLFADVKDAELEAIGSPKASMSLIEPAQSTTMQAAVKVHTQQPGGSAANSVAGIARLGLPTGFIGKIAEDDLGRVFTDAFQKLDVAFPNHPDTRLPTGHCLVLVTPDAERTMHTVLGASVTTSTDDLDDGVLARTGLFFAEGYIWDSPSARDAFLVAAESVHAQGGKVAFSLADGFCVTRHHADFMGLLDSHIDILLANETEIAALFGSQDPADLGPHFAAHDVIGAVTYGAEGAYVFAGAEVCKIDAQKVDDIVDLTGAGDQFAAGFLAGLHRGHAPETAGKMGVLAASHVIRQFGPRPQTDVAAQLKAQGLTL